MFDSSQLPQPASAFSRRRASDPCSCNDVIALVARQKHLPIRALMHRTRRPPIARARQLAMYLSHVMLGRTLAEVGHAFGRDRTTVSYACAVVEDLRDDPHFDAEVTSLEQQIEARLEGADHE